MRDKVSDYLKNKLGVTWAERITILDRIFGHDGILNAKDNYEFEERCATIVFNGAAKNSPDFYNYFTKSLKPKLALNFQHLDREGLNSASKQANNNAESIHNIVKININWKPQSTPALINMLSDMVKLQMLDLQRALYSLGNYHLFGVSRKFCIRVLQQC